MFSLNIRICVNVFLFNVTDEAYEKTFKFYEFEIYYK